MNVLIIEDEPLVAKDLNNLLASVVPEAKVLATLGSVRQSLEWLSQHSAPDLILSDIQLSDGISFSIFEQGAIHCPIIFTTAYDEYAIRAFKLNSIDYLLKPIDARDLKAAIAKFNSLNSHQELTEQLKFFLASRNERKMYKERFLSLQRNSMVPVMVDQIAFFHKEELIFLHTKDNEKLLSEHQTLDEVENLVDPEKFFRVNRQYLVHIQSVGKIKTTHKGLAIQLKAPFTIEIDLSREKATAFKNWIG